MPRRLKLALLLLPLAAALAIGLDTPLHRLPQVRLAGVVVAAQLPAVTAGGIWEGRFQPGFEKYFDSRLSLRGQMVRFDDSLALALFHEIAARTGVPIILGKDETLFEMSYIDGANDVADLKNDPPPPGPYSVDEAARRLGRAARAFDRLGLAFVLVLYPHKVWLEPERVPARWQLPGGRAAAAAGYARLLAALRRNDVPFVDGVAVLTELREREPGLPLFSRGGTHWTEPAACAVAQRLVEAVAPEAVLRCALGPARRAHGTDMDLAVLINVWDATRFADRIPTLKASLAAPLAGGPRPAVVIGTSFAGRLIEILTGAGVVRGVTRAMYFRSDQAARFDWSKVLRARLVVLEQSQGPFVTVNLTEFLGELERRVPEFAAALAEEP
jgi:hypothetical protein